MSDYIVSARKYRPESFGTLIGQDTIAQTLKNSIRRGKLAHAYLFCGPRGVGKTTTARIFAKMINCSSPLENGDPCGGCESCVSFAEGRSYCIYEMDAASNNSVDDIKELIDKVRIAPQVGRYSVYIIDEVHMLSQQAFNAFLKTLEEPPEWAVFILCTTEKHKILPTILSRCQTYDFNRISVDNIVRNLRMIASAEGIKADDESLHVIALKADGAMRDALTIFDQAVSFCGNEITYQEVIRNLNVLDYEYSFALVENFLSGDYASALRSFDEILSKGFNALHFASTLSSHLRDLLVARAGGIDSLLELSPSLKDRYREQASRCSEKFLYDALSQTMACEAGYRMSVNPRLHIEFCLMKLCFLTKTPAPAPVQAQAPAQAQAPQSPVQPQAAAQAPTPAPAPVQPQAPAQSQAPAQAQANGAARSFGAGLSIKSIKETARQEEAAQAPAVQADSAAIPDEQTVKEAWKQLCDASKPNPRLYNALTTADLAFSLEDGRRCVRYSVINESLKSWLEGNNQRIEGKLRELAGSPLIKLIVDLKPEDPAEKTIVTPEEKAREMMSANPSVAELVGKLGLEIK